MASARSYSGKRIAIYGAGRVGKNYYTQLVRYQGCRIVAWVDEGYAKRQSEIDYFTLSAPKDLIKCDFDYVLIAVLNQHVSEQIKENLRAMGIEEKKIRRELPQIIF